MTESGDVNAAQCPDCKAYVVPSVDVNCWRCGKAFLGEHFWDFLYDIR